MARGTVSEIRLLFQAKLTVMASHGEGNHAIDWRMDRDVTLRTLSVDMPSNRAVGCTGASPTICPPVHILTKPPHDIATVVLVMPKWWK